MGYPSYVGSDIKTWLNQFKFSTSFKTRFSETDAFGHINNVSYFAYFEQARLDYLENLNLFSEFSSLDNHSDNNNLIVTANLECNYLAQLYYGQQIRILVRTAKLGRSSVDIEYCLLEEKSNKIAAIGRGAIVYINKESGRSEPIPERVRNIITEYENVSLSTA